MVGAAAFHPRTSLSLVRLAGVRSTSASQPSAGGQVTIGSCLCPLTGHVQPRLPHRAGTPDLDAARQPPVTPLGQNGGGSGSAAGVGAGMCSGAGRHRRVGGRM